jgi:hypothetical protein
VLDGVVAEAGLVSPFCPLCLGTCGHAGREKLAELQLVTLEGGVVVHCWEGQRKPVGGHLG